MKLDVMQHYDRGNNYAAKVEELELRFGRSDLTPLWVADMDLPSPEAVTNAIVKRAEQGIFGYTYRPESYFEAMTAWYRRRHDWEIDCRWVVHSPAVVTTLSLLVEQMTAPGEGILIQSPVYTPFYDVIRGRGRKVLENTLVRNSDGYAVDYEALDGQLAEAKLMILCNPHNPVGRVWKKEELLKIGELCLKHNVRVIADEIHADFAFAPNKYIPFASVSAAIEDITITCLSATKTFNIAGLQASFVLFPRQADKERFEQSLAVLDIRRNSCFNLVAVEAAYREGEAWLDTVLVYLKENLQYVREYFLREIPEISVNEPEGTYLLWMDCSRLGMDDAALSRFMIQEARVALGAGSSYGAAGSGFMRMNVACSRETLNQGLERIRNAVALHRERQGIK